MDKELQQLLAKLLVKYTNKSLFHICETSSNISEDAKQLKKEIEELAARINVDTPDVDWSIYILEDETDLPVIPI